MKKSLHSSLLVGVALLFNLCMAWEPAQALTVSPVKVELEGDPGQNLTADIRLLNEQDKSITFYASFENFQAEGEDGTPNFTSSDTDLASWINMLPTENEGEDPNVVILGPQEEASRAFSVTIPEDATPGGHFAALFWGTTPPSEEEPNVAVGAKVGILIFLRVSGAYEEGGDLLSFDTVDGKRYFDQLPIHFTYRFQNTGADRIVPEGAVHFQNIFGWESDILPVNVEQNNILPTSIRKFEETWGSPREENEELSFINTLKHQWKDFYVGPYLATLSLSYGTEEVTTANSTVQLWIFPWQILLVSTVTIVLAVSCFILIIRTYNRWIIDNAMKARRKKK